MRAPADAGARLGAFAAFWQDASLFWRSADHAWPLTIGLTAFLTVNVGVQLAVNHWHGWFFGAIERRDAETAGHALVLFAALVILVAGVGVGIVWFRETLQVRWREAITRVLVARWSAFRPEDRDRVARTAANPEYRIADDVRLAVEAIVDLAIGLFAASLSLLTFAGVLWKVGGSLAIGGVTVPGFMVLGAVLYGASATALTFWVGRALPRAMAERNAEEGRLRFVLTGTRRDVAPGNAGQGVRSTQAAVHAAIDAVVGRWLAVVRRNARLTWVANGSAALIPVAPLLLAAPKYFAGDIGLGELVQLAAAFVAVQTAVSWFVDNFRRVAECYASVVRVAELAEQLGSGPGAVAPAMPVPVTP